MISGGAVLFAVVVVCVAIAIVTWGVWCVIRAAVNLARGYSDRSFFASLKVFVLFSALTGFVVSYEWCMDGLAMGLKSLICGSKTFNSLTFWVPFAVQMVALVVLVLAWRKRRHDRDEGC